MPRRVNVIRNADFRHGVGTPSAWAWSARGRSVRWERDLPAMVLRSAATSGSGFWSQEVHVVPGKYYRVEADVTCDLAPADPQSGTVLRLRLPEDEVWETPALVQCTTPTTIRTYFKCPAGVRSVTLQVGVNAARGWASIHGVRFIKIIEPDEVSHPLSIPPPPLTCPPPRVAQRVCVCSESAADRPLTALLRLALGDHAVRVVAPDSLRAGSVEEDALLLPDAAPPASLRTLKSLLDTARDRYVIISTSAFARLAGKELSLRRIEQPDDPIHAKVTYACYATRGFALDDVFAYAWAGKTPGSFVQNQFRKTNGFKAFCERHGFVTMLYSMCDQDATSDQPICLYRPSVCGGLFVLDLDPVEARATTANEPALAMHLLLGILGRTQPGLGQYMVPFETGRALRRDLREMTPRFPSFVIQEEDAPEEDILTQLVTIGREDDAYGLPLRPKPLIVVRTCLHSGDVDGVYGAWLWFKQLVRMAPHECPYAADLCRRFRFAWLPTVAMWERKLGWRRSAESPLMPLELELDESRLGAVIDLTSAPVNRVRVVLPPRDALLDHYARWAPMLHAAFPSGGGLSLRPPAGNGFGDRDAYAWSSVPPPVEVDADAAVLDDEFLAASAGAGASVVRVELPGSDYDFTARSIERTDLAATLLEQAIGLQLGLLAVNRTPQAVQFDGFPMVPPGGVLLADHADAMLHAAGIRTA